MTHKALLTARESDLGEPCSFCGGPGIASAAIPLDREHAKRLGLPDHGLLLVRMCFPTAVAMVVPSEAVHTRLEAITLAEDGRIPTYSFRNEHGELPTLSIMVNFDRSGF